MAIKSWLHPSDSFSSDDKLRQQALSKLPYLEVLWNSHKAAIERGRNSHFLMNAKPKRVHQKQEGFSRIESNQSEIKPTPKFVQQEDNKCDITGKAATLYRA